MVDRCTRSQPGKGRNHRALVALVVVEQFHRQLQRRANAEEGVGPTAHEHVPVTLLLPDEVRDVENPRQAVHGLIGGGQAVEKWRLDARTGLFWDAKAQTGVLADRDENRAQVDMSQIQRQWVGQDRKARGAYRVTKTRRSTRKVRLLAPAWDALNKIDALNRKKKG